MIIRVGVIVLFSVLALISVVSLMLSSRTESPERSLVDAGIGFVCCVIALAALWPLTLEISS